ncbi:hypothetical protein TNCV_4719441 [Trichonephila clavipes]|uniref:Uncharacterized protein n=1 Tax=Trichonephila clavipes TaxID=2585209 RepID=A0A8X6W605_TRICX|nr:hypothetical protein TNCV_4719441 [Trichonephila clavipes]
MNSNVVLGVQLLIDRKSGSVGRGLGGASGGGGLGGLGGGGSGGGGLGGLPSCKLLLLTTFLSSSNSKICVNFLTIKDVMLMYFALSPLMSAHRKALPNTDFSEE